MDNFNVPKKVNRHVLKALAVLSNGDRSQRINSSLILEQVKHQMRNLTPVSNIDNAIHKSLKNLSEIGLIERYGMYLYALGRCGTATPGPYMQPPCKKPQRRIFPGRDPQRSSRSDLDPNMKRGHASSEESLSGDEFERTRKRMRTNQKEMRHAGRWAFLPRARQHSPHTEHDEHIHAAIDTPLISQDLYSLHHVHTQLQGRGTRRGGQDNLGAISNSAMDFMLASVTPTPSLEISEFTGDMTKIVEVREIVETPPLQPQNEAEEGIDAERKACENYEQVQIEEGVPTYETCKSVISNAHVVPKQAITKTASIQKQIQSQLSTSRQTMNSSNGNASTLQISSRSLLPDHTHSYIK